MTPDAFDDTLLDDAGRLLDVDSTGTIRAVASGGALLREGVQLAGEAGVADLAGGVPPRAVLVRAAEPTGALARLLPALAGADAATPFLLLGDGELPRWAGPADLLLVAAATADEQTLRLVDQAIRRGVPMFGVGAHDTPLAELMAGRGRSPYVGVPLRYPPRASLWILLAPLLIAAAHSGLLTVGPAELEAAADTLDLVAEQCRPGSETFVNPAKALAVELAEATPVIWGSSQLAGVAARRFAAQLAGVAGRVASWGTLPAAAVQFGGVLGDAPADGTGGGGDRDREYRDVEYRDRSPWEQEAATGWDPGAEEPPPSHAPGRRRAAVPDDFFADRIEGPVRWSQRLVLLRDEPGETAVTRRAAEVARQHAFDVGLRVSELASDGELRLPRFASLCALGDYTAVYCGLAQGIDPAARRFGNW